MEARFLSWRTLRSQSQRPDHPHNFHARFGGQVFDLRSRDYDDSDAHRPLLRGLSSLTSDLWFLRRRSWTEISRKSFLSTAIFRREERRTTSYTYPLLRLKLKYHDRDITACISLRDKIQAHRPALIASPTRRQAKNTYPKRSEKLTELPKDPILATSAMPWYHHTSMKSASAVLSPRLSLLTVGRT